MTPATADAIYLWAAILGIVASLLVSVDLLLKRWGYIGKLVRWFRKLLMRLIPDDTFTEVQLPLATSAAALSSTTAEGVTKTLRRYIMRGRESLFAYEITREGFTGTQFLVERIIPDQNPKSTETSNRDEANLQWHKWYKEWEGQPGSFGGASGTGLDGNLPW